MKYFVILLSVVVFLGTAYADPDDEYRKFPLEDSYMYADHKHITDISLSWSESFPSGTVTFDEKIDADINIMIPKNIPRMMNLDFQTPLAVFYPDTSVELVIESETDCFYHLRIPISNTNEINIDTISLAAGRWESVAVNKLECNEIYAHYSETYGLKSTSVHLELPPLKQIKNGVEPLEIKCNRDMHLTQKYDGSPACVNPATHLELIKRGWVSNMVLAIQSRDMLADPEDVLSSYMGKITPTLDDFKNVLSQPYDIDEIFSKFGEPHDDIGSGIHIYVYDLNDDTGIWIGYADDIWYIHHVDSRGNQIEELFAKPSEPLAIFSGLQVDITGEQQVRRGTTHDIVVDVFRDAKPISDATVRITIEDYGEDVIRDFKGRTDDSGRFVFSWEIPKSFDDVKTLLAYVDVTDDVSAKTALFKFQVYCLPGEAGCKVEGN